MNGSGNMGRTRACRRKPAILLRPRSRKFGAFFSTVSVVEGAGRNLVDNTRKSDKRDDGKDADPIREAHGLRPHYCGDVRRRAVARVAQTAFRPINVPRARAFSRAARSGPFRRVNLTRWRARGPGFFPLQVLATLSLPRDPRRAAGTVPGHAHRAGLPQLGDRPIPRSEQFRSADKTHLPPYGRLRCGRPTLGGGGPT
jgi:hypothetical protein